jgi:phosphoesterase RecJ-like protein
MNKILKAIQESQSIVIFRHIKPDGDAIGSQFGLKYLLQENFPDKTIYAYGTIIQAFEPFSGKSDVITDEIIKDSLAIVLDVANKERVDGHFSIAKNIIKIDHHEFVEAFSDTEVVDTTAPATAFLIASFAQDYSLKLSPKSATLLLLGIITDTGKFSYGANNPKLFKMVAYLMEQGADITKIYEQLFSQTEVEQMHLKGYFQTNFSVTDNGVAYLKIKEDVLQKYHVSGDEAAVQVNTIGNLKNVQVHAFFSIVENNNIRCEIRSKGINIQPIAVKYGGGGHKQASGALVKSWDIVDNIIKDLDALVLKNNIDLAITAYKQASIAIMDIYNNMPIQVTIKSDDSPVTQADLLSDKIIHDVLKQSGYLILSEETEDNPDRLKSDFIWIVDPIDGTKDFIAKTDQFAVNIALCKNHEIIFGLIGVPAQNIYYYATKGNGAYKVDLNTNTQTRIYANKKKTDLEALISNFHTSKEELDYINQRSSIITHSRKVGSALKGGIIAEGKGDIYIKFGEHTKEWDVAPFAVILKEAGGYFALPNGEIMLFNRKDVYNRAGYIVANSKQDILLVK